MPKRQRTPPTPTPEQQKAFALKLLEASLTAIVSAAEKSGVLTTEDIVRVLQKIVGTLEG